MARFRVDRDFYSDELEYLQVRNTFTIHGIMIFFAVVAASINLMEGRPQISLFEFAAVLVFLPMLYLYPRRLYQLNAWVLNFVFVAVVYAIAFTSKNDITILSISPLAIVIGFLMNGRSLGLATTILVFSLNMAFLNHTDFVAPTGKSADYLNLTMSPFFTFLTTLVFSSNLRSSLRKVASLAEENTQLTYQSSMAKLGGAVAHEINNPLYIISGTTDLLEQQLLMGNLDKEKLISRTKKIRVTVDRISRVTKALLDISKEPDDDELELAPIKKILETSTTLCAANVSANGILLSIENETDNIALRCRWQEISRAVVALLNNAITATHGDLQAWIKLRAFEKDGSVFIEISDSGQGERERIKRSLRGAFFTSDDVGVGSGVGLGLAKGIISKYGGKITLVEPSKHTCLRIELPKP